MSERVLLVNWYCTRRHYADREGETSRFLCGSGYGFPEYEFAEWQQKGYGNGNTRNKVWGDIPICKSCLKRAGEKAAAPVDWRKVALQTEAELHDLLAKALGYPLYEPGEPGYAKGRDNYVTGDHVAASLAMEAATKLEQYGYVYRICEIIADFDLGDEVFWHRGGGLSQRVDADGKKVPEKGPLVGAVLVNDVFWYATSDLEDIEPSDIPVLRATLEEVGYFYGGVLWVARKRGMRPQMAWIDGKFHKADPEFPREAFLAAGPERTREEEG